MTNEKRFENWLKTQKNKTVEEYKKLSDSTQKKYIATFKKWVLDISIHSPRAGRDLGIY